MATGNAKRPPRGLYVTRAALRRATNEQILEAFEDVGEEVVRRIQNFGETALTPMSLLDGITFAGRAQRIQCDFTHHHWPYGLHHAVRTLTGQMAGPWEEADLTLEGMEKAR